MSTGLRPGAILRDNPVPSTVPPFFLAGLFRRISLQDALPVARSSTSPWSVPTRWPPADRRPSASRRPGHRRRNPSTVDADGPDLLHQPRTTVDGTSAESMGPRQSRWDLGRDVLSGLAFALNRTRATAASCRWGAVALSRPRGGAELDIAGRGPALELAGKGNEERASGSGDRSLSARSARSRTRPRRRIPTRSAPPIGPRIDEATPHDHRSRAPYRRHGVDAASAQ